MNQTAENKHPQINFTALQKLSVGDFKLPPLKVNGIINIKSRVIDTGIQVFINNKIVNLRYPPTIWRRFPKIHKKILAQNLAFGLTYHLPYIYTSLKKMQYNMPVPLSEAFFFKGMSLALPSTAIMQTHKDKRVTSNLLRRLYDVDYVFSNTKTDIPLYNRVSLSDQTIMPFTFGKDSLLTFALARELGLTVYPVYISEPYSPYEEMVKKLLAEQFKKEFKVNLAILRNTMGIFREPDGWFGWEMQLTQYSLMLLPYVYAKRAGFILFSNEQSCDDTIVDQDGFRYNPVFEQSHGWLLQNSLMASIIGGNSLSIGSLLEPIHEIAITRILHHRFPEFAKYQSSCDLPEKPKSGGRWCENCSKCGRMYIYLLANGIDPKTVGFKHDLLRQKYQHLYTIFQNRKVRDYGYDQSEAGKKEQLLAFYLAYKQGLRQPVMLTFMKKYLKAVRKKEKILRKIYFGIHSTKTIPDAIRPRVLQIFRSELKSMQ